MTTTTTRLDKRLRPAKVIGIILFVLSIVSFASNIGGGLFTMVLWPDLKHVFEQNTVFSGPMDWVFNHFTVLAFSFSLFWIPLFFSSRALYRFKEWGRIMCIVMLILLIFIIGGYAYAFFSVRFAPLPFRLISVMIFIVYAAALCVPIYFLLRRSTREGIRDYNQHLPDTTPQVSE